MGPISIYIHTTVEEKKGLHAEFWDTRSVKCTISLVEGKFMRTHVSASVGKLFRFCFDSIFSKPTTHTLTQETLSVTDCKAKTHTGSHNYPCRRRAQLSCPMQCARRNQTSTCCIRGRGGEFPRHTGITQTADLLTPCSCSYPVCEYLNTLQHNNCFKLH